MRRSHQWRILRDGEVIRQDYALTLEGCKRYVEWHLKQTAKPHLCQALIITPMGTVYRRMTTGKQILWRQK